MRFSHQLRKLEQKKKKKKKRKKKMSKAFGTQSKIFREKKLNSPGSANELIWERTCKRSSHVRRSYSSHVRTREVHQFLAAGVETLVCINCCADWR
jgi:hypothetical protein